MPEIPSLDHLNKEQREAVRHIEGPLLVVAGAGSGKTRVITEKISYLCALGTQPFNILAITFTNKACAEMKERILGMGVEGVWVSTFHAMCVRILRREAEHIGLSEQFSIYDTDDQKSVLRSILKDLKLDTSEWKSGEIISLISHYKTSSKTVEDVEDEAVQYRDRYYAKIYRMYQKSLETNQALDFDDLLSKCIELFDKHSEILARYQNRFQHVLVDEYQDTNAIQYNLTMKLSARAKSVSLTGDPDQSIYSWRGADISNILNFEKDFKEARIIKLEQNYRSTSNILNLANQVILHNTQRYPKNLLTDNEMGLVPILHCTSNSEDEASKISSQISALRAKGKSFGDMAVFYRTNAQSRSIEEAIGNSGIPYVLIGGVRFFDRMEVRDLIAYMRFIQNPADSISLMRIINRPTRGISETTKARIRDYADDNGLTCWKAMISESFVFTLASRAKNSVSEFSQMMAGFFENFFVSPEILLEKIIDSTGIIDFYSEKKKDGKADEERSQNIGEFMSFVSEFCSKNSGANLHELLENIALMTDKKESEEAEVESVTLMTLHAAKGLEFKYVFFAGLDEGILPHQRSIDDGEISSIEEERRLCYVGITRAMLELHLYQANERFQYNRSVTYRKSRFISEMEGDYLEIVREGAGHFKPRKKKGKSQFSMSPNQGQRFRRGEPVKHPKFGKGIILKIEGKGSSEKAKIFFDKFGEKSILIEFEPLESL